MKFLAILFMMNQIDKVWGICYINNSQLTTFIISDFFWIFLLIYYYASLLKLQ